MGRHEASRRWRLARFAPVWEEEEDGWRGREGGLGRPRGRGPVGEREWPVGEEKKKWAAAAPKGRMGRLAVGPKVKEFFF
jgi:hypothetical protein